MWYLVAFLIGWFAGRAMRLFTWPLRGDLGALPLTLERRERLHDATLH